MPPPRYRKQIQKSRVDHSAFFFSFSLFIQNDCSPQWLSSVSSGKQTQRTELHSCYSITRQRHSIHIQPYLQTMKPENLATQILQVLESRCMFAGCICTKKHTLLSHEF